MQANLFTLDWQREKGCRKGIGIQVLFFRMFPIPAQKGMSLIIALPNKEWNEGSRQVGGFSNLEVLQSMSRKVFLEIH